MRSAVWERYKPVTFCEKRDNVMCIVQKSKDYNSSSVALLTGSMRESRR